MKLREFQESAGVPVGEQLCLLGHDDFSSLFYHLDTTYPPKVRLPIGELRKWVQRYRRFRWATRLDLTGRQALQPILIADKDGRLEHLEKLKVIAKKFGSDFDRTVIVLGKSDLELNDEIVDIFESGNCSIFGNNLNTLAHNAHYYPMGRDFRSRGCHAMSPSADKQCLAYCNFSLNTHSARRSLWPVLRNLEFVDAEHMAEYGKYELSSEQFYQKVRRSKFCIAPRGNAIECYRMWDSIYLGTIPIVVREAVFHRQIEDLPILFLDSYEDFGRLSAERLEDIYETMLDQDWDYEKLRFSYWRRRIDEVVSSL